MRLILLLCFAITTVEAAGDGAPRARDLGIPFDADNSSAP